MQASAEALINRIIPVVRSRLPAGVTPTYFDGVVRRNRTALVREPRDSEPDEFAGDQPEQVGVVVAQELPRPSQLGARQAVASQFRASPPALVMSLT